MSYNLIFTPHSLEVALQRSQGVSWLDPNQFVPAIEWGLARVRMPTGVAFIHPADASDERRIIFHDIGSGHSLDRLPQDAWRQALQRAHRAALASTFSRLRLPIGWSEYHLGNLVAFFACNRSFGSYRWVAELRPAGSNDISFWRITDDTDQILLANFAASPSTYQSAVAAWDAARIEAERSVFSQFARPSQYAPLDGVIDLRAATYGAVAGHLTYGGWIEKLTQDQKRFVEHSSRMPVKLRGPAGSGKTLALELKVLRESYAALDDEEAIRMLFITHSWAMAENVDQSLRTLDERGTAGHVTVLPLVEVAKSLLPQGRYAQGLTLLGEDSYQGRRVLLNRISDTLLHLRAGDWLAYQAGVSVAFRQRVESTPKTPEWNSLVWDLMHEFSSVLAASGILPGITAEKRYLGLRRTDWMMSLVNESEKRFVLRVYSEHVKALRTSGEFSIDQLMNDFLNYLETFAWDYRRDSDGFDLIFIDEFHLFSDQERQILNYLSRDAQRFPRVFLALDPRQSPSEVYADFPVADITTAQSREADSALGKADSVDLKAVHRFSAQILEFVKFIHQSFPTLQLGADWFIDTSALYSTAADSDPPLLFQYSEGKDEVEAVIESAAKRYGEGGHRIAVILIDETRLSEFESVFQRRGTPLVTITSRDDIDTLRYTKRSVVLSAAEYVGGLQFDDVLVAGFPASLLPQRITDPQLRRVLSSFYVAVTRASREVEIHFLATSGEGDLATLLQRAVKAGVVDTE